jgi:antitoxin component YwqK of YwqJK toxin-antitoxin module
MPDGRTVMHGMFKQLRLDGKVAFEGAFEEGLKTGIWTIYNEKGETVSEKYFERGIERNYKMPQPSETPPPAKRR